ncbi:MAG: hypothetical protein HZA90_17375 [Verrucomicrobia bacterium]|nr:hypothetical protein [Verrucomicrobiota bacterium]
MARPPPPTFPGFPAFRSNVTYVPIQFFTVVLPHSSRGTVRIVGYALRKVLGWVDEHGQPMQEQLRFTYRELIEKAGVSREAITEALQEALDKHLLRCVQTPQPDTAGRPGRSGVYELCWDMVGGYTDNPAQFQGFHYAEAAVLEADDGSAVARRPRAARKNIPNAFFDVLLPRERLSVIRVVGALLFYSIQWGSGGERRVPVSLSITALSRLTRMSRQHVHAAVLEARQRGYLEPVEAGYFDPAAGQSSRAATYGIRWITGPAAVTPAARVTVPTGLVLPPVRKGEREQGDRSEKVDGGPVQKSERTRSEKVNEERSERVNGIRIKTESKTHQTTTAGGAEPMTGALDSGAAAVEALVKQGFEETTAQHLAQRHSLEVIQRQIEWLPLRRASRSRLGLLRRAIEHDWPKPEGTAPTASVPTAHEAQARLFAAHYYGAYHGLEGPAQTEPFPKDLQAAGPFVACLLQLQRDERLVPQWGRQFGRLMRDKHQGDPQAKPNLSFALTLFGGLFLRQLQSADTARRKQALGTAQARHQAAFYARYEDYLRQSEITLQQAAPALYVGFLERRQETRHNLTGRGWLISAETLAKFESERSRLLGFAEFFHRHPQHPVLDFWEWDGRLNPQRFGSGVENKAGLQEAHA